jgi:glutamine---fructose-6-phosphate transaminase (isomerizing)
MTPKSLHANPYLQDILDQPRALQTTLKAFSELDDSAFNTIFSRLRSGKFQRIVLTGMGSSFHVFHPIFLALIEQGLQVQMIETSELIHYAGRLLEPSTLIIAVSQSGRSVEMIQLLERVQGKVVLIGVTNSADSPLALRADAALLTRAGMENTVSCKTYVTALAALAVLARILTGQELGPSLLELQSAAELVAGYLSHWETHVEAASGLVKDVQFLMLAGRGASQAAASTGGLIIKEAAHFPAEGMSCAALRHGPLDMMSSRILAVIYAGDRRTAQLNAGLVTDLRKAGGRAYLVRTSDERDVFSLPPSPLTVLPILETLPAQMLSLALALTHGHTPGQFEHGVKVTSVE